MRWGIFVLAALTALVVAGAGVIATQLRDVDGPPRVELAPGVVAVAAGKSYAYVLRGASGVVLIDAGSDCHARAITDELARTKQTLADVRAVLITSAHPFTLGGLAKLREVPVYVGAGDEDLVRGTRQAGAPLARLYSRMHTRRHRDNPVVPVLAGAHITIDGITVDAIATPGVSDGGRTYLTHDTAFVGPALTTHAGRLSTPSFWLADRREHIVRSMQRLDGASFAWLAGSTFTPRSDGRALYTAWESDIPETARLRTP